ncbi:M15 family metallopeptidase [Desulfovibrio sp. ZJ369]|uniref:M15 family metallopeptidase n=1 Tax=Desulfovibrio sp. ZJ369 TaxID=2709793 RepID=UPI0013EACDFF|nr:M15 family metallopeptidase [Desulfovibrio sp. ZJ369]
MRLFSIFCLFWMFCAPRATSAQFRPLEPAGLDAVNMYCLRSSYPQIRALVADDQGRQWLLLANGSRVLYSAAPKPAGDGKSAGTPRAHSEAFSGLPRFSGEQGEANVRESMEQPYPLEPQRPATPPGVAPGRRRSSALLKALYGASEAEVRKNLRVATLLGRPLRLVCPAALGLQRAGNTLAAAVRGQPALAALLTPAGGFLWRRIAGEQRLSPHAFGIALDVSPERAPYWRWTRQWPHPMQQSYPTAIVAAFEDQGFIWGGKWHEYDLMHFEYRPEIICRARLLRAIERAGERLEAGGAVPERKTGPEEMDADAH